MLCSMQAKNPCDSCVGGSNSAEARGILVPFVCVTSSPLLDLDSAPVVVNNSIPSRPPRNGPRATIYTSARWSEGEFSV